MRISPLHPKAMEAALDAMQPERSIPDHERDCAKRIKQLLDDHPPTWVVIQRMAAAQCKGCDAGG